MWCRFGGCRSCWQTGGLIMWRLSAFSSPNWTWPSRLLPDCAGKYLVELYYVRNIIKCPAAAYWSTAKSADLAESRFFLFFHEHDDSPSPAFTIIRRSKLEKLPGWYIQTTRVQNVCSNQKHRRNHRGRFSVKHQANPGIKLISRLTTCVWASDSDSYYKNIFCPIDVNDEGREKKLFWYCQHHPIWITKN